MKTINVVAAIIKSEDRVLATQRGYGDLINKWEFPGGKVEKDETPEDALKREIKEELNAEIEIDRFLMTVEYDYPTFRLSMRCYICSLLDEKIELLEHSSAKWLHKNELGILDWCPADVEVSKKVALEL